MSLRPDKRLWKVLGFGGLKKLISRIRELISDPLDPSYVIVIGDPEQYADFRELVETQKRDGKPDRVMVEAAAMKRLITMVHKEDTDLANVIFSLGSEQDTEELIDQVRAGVAESEDARPVKIRTIVLLYQESELLLKYLPRLQERCPAVTIYSIESSDEPSKGGIVPWENAAERVSWIRGDTVTPRQLRWHWINRIPSGFVVVFAGDPSLGKTLMVVDFIARGSVGATWLDGEPNTAGAFESIILSCEDDPSVILVPRLMAAGADLTRIHFLDSIQTFDENDELVDERMAALDRDLDVIRKKIEEHPAIRLVMVDPFSNYIGNADLFREQEVRNILTRIVRLASELDVTFVLINHNSKQTGRSALHKVIGAVGVVGTGRIGWSFVKDEKNPDLKHMLCMKENLGKFTGITYTTESVPVVIDKKMTSQAKMKFIGLTDRKADDAVAQAEDPEQKKINRAERIVEKHMPKDRGDSTPVPGPPISEELRKECGYDRNRAQSLREEMNIGTQNIKGVWHWFWKPRGAEPQQPELPV